MSALLGYWSLSGALLFATLQGISIVSANGRVAAGPIWSTKAFAIAQVSLTTLAYLTLTFAFFQYDTRIDYVARFANADLPWGYRLTAVWAEHQGSLFLWIWALALWTAAVALFAKPLPNGFLQPMLGVLGCISAALLALLLGTANPFVPLQGTTSVVAQMNPLLQDPSMAAHPPLLYAGYTGSAIAFAAVFVGLCRAEFPPALFSWIRPWATMAWSFLTLGLLTGAWWSYYELGWGGWWFWDPVENVALLPWLMAVALVHALAVTIKRQIHQRAASVFALVVFSLSVFGTFFGRSGAATSIHTFATDPAQGSTAIVVLVALIMACTSLVLFRGRRITTPGHFRYFSHEALIVTNNALLCVVACVVLVGTVYPAILSAIDGPNVTVGSPFYADVLLVPFVLITFLAGVAFFSRWAKSNPNWRQNAAPAATVAAILAVATLTLQRNAFSLALIVSVASASFLIASSLLQGRTSWLPRLSGNRLELSKQAAHLGVGIAALGIACGTSGFYQTDVRLGVGESTVFAKCNVKLIGVHEAAGANYGAVVGTIGLTCTGREQQLLLPERRTYSAYRQPFSETSIDSTWARDVLVTLGEPLGNGKWSLRFQYRPFVRLLWIGCALVAFGGIFGAISRRAHEALPRSAG